MEIKELEGISRIFYELISGFVGREEDDDVSLKEIIKGMLDLTKCRAVGASEVFSGIKFEIPDLMI